MGKSNTEKSKEFRKCQLADRTFGVTKNQEEEQNQIQTILKKQKETEEKGNFLNFPPSCHGKKITEEFITEVIFLSFLL